MHSYSEENQRADQVHTEHAVLDIGQDVGALIIYTGPEWRSHEIEVSLNSGNGSRIHTAVLQRHFNNTMLFAALFVELQAGEYTVWKDPIESADRVSIVGGEVAELDWRFKPHHHHGVPHAFEQKTTVRNSR